MKLLLGTILRKRVIVCCFIVLDDFGHLFPEFAKQIGELIKAEKFQYREEMIKGWERAPPSFVRLLQGEAFGKRVVRLTV